MVEAKYKAKYRAYSQIKSKENGHNVGRKFISTFGSNKEEVRKSANKENRSWSRRNKKHKSVLVKVVRRPVRRTAARRSSGAFGFGNFRL